MTPDEKTVLLDMTELLESVFLRLSNLHRGGSDSERVAELNAIAREAEYVQALQGRIKSL